MEKNSGIDIVLSFDLTGSMAPCLSEVRRKLTSLLGSLFDKIPELRIGVIAHGDYCDKERYFVTRHIDLTSDREKLIKFVNSVSGTDGGDADECYELALHEARSLTWTAGRSRVLVVIGDANPHEVNYPLNWLKLDWRNEARMLKECGIQVYSVQCLNRHGSDRFYSELASITDGLHLKLDQFRHVEKLLLGIAFKQESSTLLQELEDETYRDNKTEQITKIFDTLAEYGFT